MDRGPRSCGLRALLRLVNAKCERTSVDPAESNPDRFCRVPSISAARSRSPGPCAIANRTHTRGFRTILPEVRKLKDWMVDEETSGIVPGGFRGTEGPDEPSYKALRNSTSIRSRLPGEGSK
jgi:hypothetical protein